VVEAILARRRGRPPAEGARVDEQLKVDLKGLRGGAARVDEDNHFRTKQFYRVWRWDPAANRVERVQDWQAIEVKR